MSERKSDHPPAPEAVELSNRERFTKSYEHQGITVNKVHKLIDRMWRIIDDPEGVADETRARINELTEAIDQLGPEERGHRDALIREREGKISLEKEYRAGKFTHLEAFYSVSSDNLPALREQINVKDKTIATVASNGDFWQVFTESGAKEVTIFDVSLPALLYSELKLAGLQQLSFEEYRSFFGASEDEIADKGKTSRAFIDPVIYAKLKPELSAQAQTFFDEVGNPRQNLVGASYIDDPFQITESFIRHRKNQIFIGDLITDAVAYDALAKRAQETRYALLLANIAKPHPELQGKDLIYSSNIGYELRRSLELAKACLEQGTEKVALSTSRRRMHEYNLSSSFGVSRPGDPIQSEGVQIREIHPMDFVLEGGIVLEITKA